MVDFMERGRNRFFNLKWSRYIPKDHFPHAKQIAFLALPHLEALYGGAAYGGKSDVLLMGALQYFDQPKYKGILFRQQLTAHNLSDSILSRAKEWLAPFIKTKEVKYVSGNHTFYSKEGGELAFQYLKNEGDELRYDSAQYHYVGFDELTHFSESQYTYLFSRMRRIPGADDKHIPVKMRGGTNPGGPGHAWVRKRFCIVKDEDGEFRGKNPLIPFIQAKVNDNPSADAKSYIRSLDKMRPLERDRKKNGDWSASEDSVLKDHWFNVRWWYKNGYYILDDGNEVRSYHEKELFIFSAIDSACSEMTGIENRSFRKGKEASFNDCGIFALTPKVDLLWLDNIHGQWHVPEFCNRILDRHRKWAPAFARVESNTIGSAVCQILDAKGLTVHPLHSSRDKLERSLYAQVGAEAGKIWLPDPIKTESPWLQEVEDEIFVWTGKDGELSDIVDVLSSAAAYRSQKAYGREREHISRGISGGRPVAVGGLRRASAVHPMKARRLSGRKKVLFQPMVGVRS
jgi:phage terminase large subunit-like protein